MASVNYSLGTFTENAMSKSSVSDLLRSSTNGVCGVPLKFLGKARLGAKTRRFTVDAKVRTVKKYEYPWPDDPDPNVKGGVLSHLSHFKPSKEKSKPVTLDFERPILDLRAKIVEVQKMANETGLDFTDQIISLEMKYQQALKDLYTHLTPIQLVNVARHPNRPTFLDHIFNITEKFVELHGDRAGYDDPAIVTGLGTINGRRYMFIGHQKGRNTKENIHRNFGMPTPHGYRKALRMMRYADHHGFPIVTFIDTPGAYADLKSEQLGQGEAIAQNLRTMFGLKVPIFSIVIGEGGSGGALAIGCANKLFMLENAVFYVASPEACAAIIWKNSKFSPKAAEQLKITSRDLTRLGIVDGVIPEPLGGAHTDPYWTSQQIKTAIVKTMDELVAMDADAVLKHRTHKFRSLVGYVEGVPIDPIKRVNMKMKEEPIVPVNKSSESELKDEVEKVKEQVMKSGKLPVSALRDMIEKLEDEIELEYDEAAKALGLDDKIFKVQEEAAKAREMNDELSQTALKEKIEQLKHEFDENLHKAPNYSTLMYKLNTLKELSRDEMKLEINYRFAELFNNEELKRKIEFLEGEISGMGESDIESSPELKERVMQLKREIQSAFKSALGSTGLQVVPLDVGAKQKVDAFEEETKMIIDNAVNSSGLKEKIETLKAELAKADKLPGEESDNKIQALISEIKEAIKEAVSSRELKEKHEKLFSEVSEATKSSVETTNAPDESQIKVNVETNHIAI